MAIVTPPKGKQFYTGRYAYKNSSDPKVSAMPSRTYQAATSHPFNPLADNSQFVQPKGKVLGSFKKGGAVHKTGIYKLHKGEKVISKAQLAKAATKHMFNSKRSA